jgi:hypothetical protein
MVLGRTTGGTHPSKDVAWSLRSQVAEEYLKTLNYLLLTAISEHQQRSKDCECDKKTIVQDCNQ